MASYMPGPGWQAVKPGAFRERKVAFVKGRRPPRNGCHLLACTRSADGSHPSSGVDARSAVQTGSGSVENANGWHTTSGQFGPGYTIGRDEGC